MPLVVVAGPGSRHYTAPGGGGDGNDGLVVTDYADYDPDDAQLQTITLNSTIANWGTTGGGNVAFSTGTWWNGASVPLVDMYPPTANEWGSGIGAISVWKGGAKTVRQLNVRFEWQPTSAYCADTTQLPKFVMIKTYRALNDSGTPERPMLYLSHFTGGDSPSIHIANSLVLVPAQGTTRMFSSTNLTPAPGDGDYNPPDPDTYDNCRQSMYWRATSGTDGAGNPIIAASEVVCIEMRVNVMSTTDEPEGVIACRIYRRNGQVIERACAWTWEEDHTVDTNYIEGIEQFGGGYYNNSNASGANMRTTMGRAVTIATNLSPTLGRAWIGAPTGFVT